MPALHRNGSWAGSKSKDGRLRRPNRGVLQGTKGLAERNRRGQGRGWSGRGGEA